MIYNLEITEEAVYDTLEAIDWYKDISKKLSFRFEADLNSRLNYLSAYPLNFQIRYLKKVRIVPLNTFPYGIHFFVEQNTIFVVAIFHYKKTQNAGGQEQKKCPSFREGISNQIN